jgi:hypothetical protein
MPDARSLTLADLREIVSDASELAKGAKIVDDKLLSHLSRFEHKLFADAAGSGSSPYKVQILFDDKAVKGRCSCMAARSRPFCKHAAALLVAWARAPEAFAVAAAPPPGAPGDAKSKEVKTGKVDAKEFMARGVEQVGVLIRELAVSGVASLAADRVDQVRALGEALREAKLRRLSARTLDLAGHLAKAASRSEAFDAPDYAELLGDLLLTVRKLEKYVGGEALAAEYVEELIGKTWTKKDRKPVADLDLVEYAFVARTTADDFVIRESRFIDLRTGDHFAEKQILPAFLAKRTEPKKSWAGRVLEGAHGSLYPTFSPRRLDLEDSVRRTLLDASALERLLERAVPSVAAALSALQERRKDVFAPDALPVALRVDSIVAEGARMQVVDASSAALFLPDEPRAEEALSRVLRDASLEAIVGDVALDGALPTLFPLAALVRRRGVLALELLGTLDAGAVLETKKVRAKAAQVVRGPASRWVDVARNVGASGAAIALGEVRDEMADALSTGLSAVNTRFCEPLATRLRDLGLAKQGDLLAGIGAKNDPADKLDDFVKLHQVLGIALARLAGASHVDRAALAPVPTYESVFVRVPERTLEPREVAALQALGTMNRYQAAVHYARHYDALGPGELARSIYPTWADGAAVPFVARALAAHPEQAVDAARRVLGHDGELTRGRGVYSDPRLVARVAKLTAIRVLAAAGTGAAKELLLGCVRRKEADASLAAHARRALKALSGSEDTEETRAEVGALVGAALNASQKEDRIKALRAIADRSFVEAIPAVRASFAGDVSADVREEAAYALAALGDVESVETFVELLRNRASDVASAKIGAYALGMLGDVRGVDELVRAYAEGWHPGILAEAIRRVGPAALEPVVDLIEARPEIADRKAALGVVAAVPPADVERVLLERLNAPRVAPAFCSMAVLYVTIASAHDQVAKTVAKRIAELRPAIFDRKKGTTEEKALGRKCSRYLEQ